MNAPAALALSTDASPNIMLRNLGSLTAMLEARFGLADTDETPVDPAVARILGREKRAAMFEIYSFCREVDDIADEDRPRPRRLELLSVWRKDIESLYSGSIPPGLENLARAISPDGFPVVALAAAFGHFPIVKYLFEKGADLTAVATNGTG